jgi:hypothetical protein
MKRFSLILIVVLLSPKVALGQSRADLTTFHDRAVAVIRQLSSRPLTPGDTFFTWYSGRPGGLIHTVARTDTTMASSLLRADGMIGTAEAHWRDGRLASFDTRWTTQDSTTHAQQVALEARGIVVGDSLRITGTHPATLPLPQGPWVVADFGMEEQLIPVELTVPAGRTVLVHVYRPWHSRWDSVKLTMRDTADLHVAELVGSNGSHSIMALDPAGALLMIGRFDEQSERHPLETTSRYEEYLRYRSLLADLYRRYAMRLPPGG